MTANGIAFQLQPLAPLTGGIGSGLFPTPAAQTAGTITPDQVAGELKPNQRVYSKKTGKHMQVTLDRYVKLWPTSSANEDAAGTPDGNMQSMLGSHPSVCGSTSEEWSRGTLNPTWVEWLMGYPEGWTDLEDSETQSSHK